ncbi:sigma-E factor negative regulatory protein [Shewanella sp. NIFS-20-20]|uniref:sigma-E factor negative regulatory protein n=1 Tax=Shewanella sp. NIFS-20-20 TaxID=2853806 RepID=UPI001C44BB3C|nr:RseA family anti-sigma factor [Shewanella sp. NIFS-20-20]MBV7314234.1 anti-sigma factor [Shewanella sp. NIFS-20-20]
MDKSGQEWVSAAVDGEIDASAFAELAKDTDSHQQWRNYHIIGDSLRSELPDTINLDLSAAIAEAIDKEPTVFAPATSADAPAVAMDSAQSSAKVVPFLRQFGQYAIAASVALFAVIGVQQMSLTPDAELAPLPVLNTRPLIGNAAPVSLQASPVQQEYSNDQMAEQRLRINQYLQDHMLQQKLNHGDSNYSVSPESPQQ